MVFALSAPHASPLEFLTVKILLADPNGLLICSIIVCWPRNAAPEKKLAGELGKLFLEKVFGRGRIQNSLARFPLFHSDPLLIHPLTTDRICICMQGMVLLSEERSKVKEKEVRPDDVALTGTGLASSFETCRFMAVDNPL